MTPSDRGWLINSTVSFMVDPIAEYEKRPERGYVSFLLINSIRGEDEAFSGRYWPRALLFEFHGLVQHPLRNLPLRGLWHSDCF